MAELGLAVIAAVDICVKVGKEVVSICSAYKNANKEVGERLIRLESCWLDTSSQLAFLRQIAKELEPDLLQNYLQRFKVLHSKLDLVRDNLKLLFKDVPAPTEPTAALSLVQTRTEVGRQLTASGSSATIQLRPWKYALFKEKLDSSIADLEAWRKVFDPSWYLMLRAFHQPALHTRVEAEASARFTVNLSVRKQASRLLEIAPRKLIDAPKSHVFLPEDTLTQMSKERILGSNASLACRTHASSGRRYIMETFRSPLTARPNTVTRNVRDIAVQLTRMEPKTFGLLRCKGVVRHRSDEPESLPSFTFVFNMPDDSAGSASSLRQTLIDGDTTHSLSERFRLASELAKAVSFIHAFGFVHKNVRPETTLLFQDGKSVLGSAYLIGFERVRNAEGDTLRLGEPCWQKDLYQHPDRQGPKLEERFVMQHDIYSLGVCLLEIGLWQPFIVIEENHPDRAADILLPLAQNGDSTELVWRGKELKAHMIELAKTCLPPKMGTKYSEVVLTCLTCLDPGNLDFGDEQEFEDEDGIVVGVRFIEKVLSKLQELVV